MKLAQIVTPCPLTTQQIHTCSAEQRRGDLKGKLRVSQLFKEVEATAMEYGRIYGIAFAMAHIMSREMKEWV